MTLEFSDAAGRPPNRNCAVNHFVRNGFYRSRTLLQFPRENHKSQVARHRIRHSLRAKPAANEIADPDFRLLHDTWPTLPAAMKAGILAMVRAVKQDHSRA